MRKFATGLAAVLLSACAASQTPDQLAQRQWADPTAAPPPYHAVTFHFVGSGDIFKKDFPGTRVGHPGILTPPYMPGPEFPGAAMDCLLSGDATAQYRVRPDSHGADFKVVAWHGSHLFGDSVLAFLEQPDIRFQLKSDGPDSTGTWSQLHTNFRMAAQQQLNNRRVCSGV